MEEQTTHLSCAETAKLVRGALKENFPSQKFSVRSSTYSMGASIDVSWTNGVAHDEVNKIIKQFAGAGFDGMIDYKYYYNHWMMPDGSLILASKEGSEINVKPHPDAKKVSFGADYVFANRDISEDKCLSTAKRLAELNDVEFVSLTDYPKVGFFNGSANWWGIAREFLWEQDLTNFGKIVKSDTTCSGNWLDFYTVLPLEGGK